MTTEQSVSGIKPLTAKAGTDGGSETVTAFGDTVEISEEGLAYSVQATTESDSAEMEMETEDADTTSAAATGTTTSSSDDEDDIEELEAQISALRKEIATLATKARNDETAKTEHSAKQAEMSGLQAELMQLLNQ